MSWILSTKGPINKIFNPSPYIISNPTALSPSLHPLPPSLKPNNRCNGLQHLFRVLRPIFVLLLRIELLSIINMIIKFPERCWARWAVDVVVPELLSFASRGIWKGKEKGKG